MVSGGRAGCASATERSQDVWRTDERDGRDGRAARGAAAPRDAGTGDRGGSTPRGAHVKTPAAFVVSRVDVDRVLARGAQAFVQAIDVEAVVVERRFVGWRIQRFTADLNLRLADIVEGDIVTRVNDLPLERPGDWMRVWDEIRRAPEIKVESIRDGDVRTIRVPILRD